MKEEDLEDLMIEAFMYYSRHIDAALSGDKELAKYYWDQRNETVKQIKLIESKLLKEE